MAKSVAEKLGYSEGVRARVEGAPADVAHGVASSPAGPYDLLLIFVRDAAAITVAAARIDDLYQDGGRLWFTYPKKSGAIVTDISRDTGWDPLTARGFLPVTQAALDDTWSALRFRRRAEIPKLTRKTGR